MSKIRVCFLASGNGGSLKVIHQAAQRLGLPLEIASVIADRDCGALAYAQAAGIPCQQVTYTRKNPAALQAALQAVAPDFVVTNIHKIIDAATLNLLPGRFLNLHYSLLPAFKGFIGMETVVQAKALNVTIIGATCHEVDEQVDNGRCLAQFAVGIDWERDTLTEVYDLVFKGAGLLLLQGLLGQAGLFGNTSVAPTALGGRATLFAPPLRFEATRLDEEFWSQVKNS